MDNLGSFLKGAVAGIAGLGLLSWFLATQCDKEGEDKSQEEQPCGH